MDASRLVACSGTTTQIYGRPALRNGESKTRDLSSSFGDGCWEADVQVRERSISRRNAGLLHVRDRKDGVSHNTRSQSPLAPSLWRAIARRWAVHVRSTDARFTNPLARCLAVLAANHPWMTSAIWWRVFSTTARAITALRIRGGSWKPAWLQHALVHDKVNEAVFRMQST